MLDTLERRAHLVTGLCVLTLGFFDPLTSGAAGQQLTNATITVVAQDVEPTPTAGDWIIRRSRNGRMLELDWADDTQWRRDIAAAELRGVKDNDLDSPQTRAISFRIDEDAGNFEFEGSSASGRATGRFRFVPNERFASTLKSMGVTGADQISVHELKNLAFGGMSARTIRELRQLGLPLKSLTDITDLAVRNVTPDYVRALQSAGLTGLTVANIADLRLRDVTPPMVAAARTKVTGRMTPETLLALLEHEREARTR